MTESSPPNPEPIFDALTAYQRTAALRSAIELDLFDKHADIKAAPDRRQFFRALLVCVRGREGKRERED